MTRTSPLQWFVRSASEEPRTWQKAAYVLTAVMLPVGIGSKRGWIIGLASAVLYGGVFLGLSFAWHRVTTWSNRHPVLDSALLVPMTFFGLAYLTNVSLGLCATISVCTWVLVASFGSWWRRRQVAL